MDCCAYFFKKDIAKLIDILHVNYISLSPPQTGNVFILVCISTL